jgi:hypothetical protein
MLYYLLKVPHNLFLGVIKMSLFQAFLNTARLFAGSAQPTAYPKTVVPAQKEPSKSLLTQAREGLASLRAAREAACKAEAEETVFQEDDFPPTRITMSR